MPVPVTGVAGVNWVRPDAAQLVQRTGFSRSRALEEGPSALGISAGADVRESSFGSILTSAIDNIITRENRAKELGVKAVTGRLPNVHDYTIAAAESKLTIELTSTIRNKAVEAFNEIMRMQA